MTPFAEREETELNVRPNTFSDQDVRVRAHQIWVRNGRPEGQAEYHWRDALAELEAEELAKGRRVPALSQVSTLPIRSVAAPRQDTIGRNAVNKRHA